VSPERFFVEFVIFAFLAKRPDDTDLIDNSPILFGSVGIHEFESGKTRI
jgi:hypothetical protein